MLQFQNETPFRTNLNILPDEEGVDTVCVTVKATFMLGARPKLAEEQLPVLLKDVHRGEPDESSILAAGEVHLPKRSTDVVVNAIARAQGRPVAQLDVSIRAAGRSKTVRVFGDRHWKPGLLGMVGMSPPEPFREMPISYERAFGGAHVLGDKAGTVLFEARNPIGLGFTGKRSGSDLKEFPLPNIESPGELIRAISDRPAPAGLGFLSPSWEPRRSYAGTYGDEWARNRAPYLPRDFDARFFQAASPDLVMDRFLTGGETFELVNAAPWGNLQFELPRCELSITVRIAGKVVEPPIRLETVLIEPEESRLVLTWRAVTGCDKSALKVERVTLRQSRTTLGGRRS